MDRTLTIRLDRAQDRAITMKARAQGKTRSAVVRELIDQALDERPLSDRIGHLKGSLTVPPAKTAWQRRIRDRNWR